MTRLPTVAEARPVSQPVITCAGDAPMMKPNGDPDDQEELKTFLVRQMYPVYWAMTNSPLATFGPLPLMSVLVTRVDGGLLDGMVTVGARARVGRHGGQACRRRWTPGCRRRTRCWSRT